MLYLLFYNPVHAIKGLLDLETIRHIRGREFTPAQAADQICSELELAQADLERLPAMRAGQIDPCASAILKRAVASGWPVPGRHQAWQ